MLLWTFSYKSLCKYIFLFLSDKSLSHISNHKIGVCLILGKNSQIFFKVVVYCHPQCLRITDTLVSLPKFDVVNIFNFSHSNGCVEVEHFFMDLLVNCKLSLVKCLFKSIYLLYFLSFHHWVVVLLYYGYQFFVRWLLHFCQKSKVSICLFLGSHFCSTDWWIFKNKSLECWSLQKRLKFFSLLVCKNFLNKTSFKMWWIFWIISKEIAYRYICLHIIGGVI